MPKKKGKRKGALVEKEKEKEKELALGEREKEEEQDGVIDPLRTMTTVITKVSVHG
eukprot:COSAG02_NODE_25139_length_668_cov_0.608084_1_plen_56_part_00